MGLREVAWIIFLGGLPFSPFIFRPHFDIWHAQTAWVHIWIMLLFGINFFYPSKQTTRNFPLGAWIIWIGGTTLWLWTSVIIKQKLYPAPLLMPFLHCLIPAFFYLAFLQVWSHDNLKLMLRYIAYAGVIVIVYGFLQIANLDQFFRNLDGGADRLVGTIGNPNHFAIYLAMLVPIFAIQSHWIWRFWIATALILIILCDSTAGILATGGMAIWCLWSWKRHWLWFLAAAIGLWAIYAFLYRDPLNPSGRLEAWGTFWELFEKKPITGLGSGFISQLSRSTSNGSILGWRHIHNEYFQVAIEQGIIGLMILGWILVDCWIKVFRLVKGKEVIALGGMLIAFMINSFFNFPAHLWLTGSLALVAYCGIYVIYNEQEELS
jgi:hypothetical protein